MHNVQNKKCKHGLNESNKIFLICFASNTPRLALKYTPCYEKQNNNNNNSIDHMIQ